MTRLERIAEIFDQYPGGNAFLQIPGGNYPLRLGTFSRFQFLLSKEKLAEGFKTNCRMYLGIEGIKDRPPDCTFHHPESDITWWQL